MPEMHHINVARSARFYTLGAIASAREVWFVCHGYAQRADAFIEEFRLLDNGSRCIIAPEGLHRFYTDSSPGAHTAQSPVAATWMTRDDRLADIADYVSYLDAVYAHVFDTLERTEVRTIALGFSQGVATVARWAGMGTATLDRVILWGGAPPRDLEPVALDRLRGTPLTIVVGTRDEFIGEEAIEREATRLHANELQYELVRFAGGHRMDRDTLRSLATSL